jgi:hypothetical protein
LWMAAETGPATRSIQTNTANTASDIDHSLRFAPRTAASWPSKRAEVWRQRQHHSMDRPATLRSVYALPNIPIKHQKNHPLRCSRLTWATTRTERRGQLRNGVPLPLKNPPASAMSANITITAHTGTNHKDRLIRGLSGRQSLGFAAICMEPSFLLSVDQSVKASRSSS